MIPRLLLFFAAATGPGIHWVENDYPKALAEASARHVPVFVEMWAPW
ncbi:MAG TPA: hypothetical protein VKX45_04910 [Bryobacteraceae bacterium]|jgi:hypothetical protein|nr:hypothetical protein [Bryobacteraceae bacterium]